MIGPPDYVDYWTKNVYCILSMQSDLFWTRVSLVYILEATRTYIPLKFNYPYEWPLLSYTM